MTSRPNKVATGAIIGSYEIEKMLGSGGFGAVYRARHVVTRKQVALKVLRARLAEENPEAVMRFKREAAVGNEIAHENIVQAFDFGEHDGQPYIAMELLEGLPLSEEVRQNGALSEERLVPIVDQIADALAAAHNAGVVHRDLKPENVFLIKKKGREDFVKLLDFGIAKFNKDQPDSVRTQTGVVFGSPDTMSPEQCRGQIVDHRSDIYSLGVVTFFLISGKFPFIGTAVEVMSGHMRDPPPRLRELVPEVPAYLDALVARALAKKPDDRFDSMESLRSTLLGREISIDEPVAPAAPVEPPDSARPTVLERKTTPSSSLEFANTTPSPPSRPSSMPPNLRPRSFSLVAWIGAVAIAGGVVAARFWPKAQPMPQVAPLEEPVDKVPPVVVTPLEPALAPSPDPFVAEEPEAVTPVRKKSRKEKKVSEKIEKNVKSEKSAEPPPPPRPAPVKKAREVNEDATANPFEEH